MSMILLLGCATNPYTQFFSRPLPQSQETCASTPLAPTRQEIYRGGEPQADARTLANAGYVFLGFSSFNGRLQNQKLALEQARNIGASVVVIYSSYANTVRGEIPLTVPTPSQTSTSTFQGTAIGAGGLTSFQGSAITTSPGGSTTYRIPYQFSRYDQGATYWARCQAAEEKSPTGKSSAASMVGVASWHRTASFGLTLIDYRPRGEQALGKGRGALVVTVEPHSAASESDLRPMDVIKAVDDIEVQNADHFAQLLKLRAGKTAHLRIERNGVTAELAATIPK